MKRIIKENKFDKEFIEDVEDYVDSLINLKPGMQKDWYYEVLASGRDPIKEGNPVSFIGSVDQAELKEIFEKAFSRLNLIERKMENLIEDWGDNDLRNYGNTVYFPSHYKAIPLTNFISDLHYIDAFSDIEDAIGHISDSIDRGEFLDFSAKEAFEYYKKNLGERTMKRIIKERIDSSKIEIIYQGIVNAFEFSEQPLPKSESQIKQAISSLFSDYRFTEVLFAGDYNPKSEDDYEDLGIFIADAIRNRGMAWPFDRNISLHEQDKIEEIIISHFV